MSFEAYQSLIDQFCIEAGLPDPRAMLGGAAFRLGATEFLLAHGGEAAPAALTVYCALGELPPSSQREAALLVLLETNLFMFGSGSNPCFAFNSENGKVLLTCALPLDGCDGVQILELLMRFDALAQEWRATYFLVPQAAREGAPARPAVARRGLPPHIVANLPSRFVGTGGAS